MKKSPTNETTNAILDFLFRARIFSFRQNISGIPVPGGGFRPSGKRGQPDIVGILPPSGRFLGIEVKTGKDRLSPEQIGFHKNSRDAGALILVVHDFNDFLTQWNNIYGLPEKTA
jgi:hypothetical protein